MGSGDVDDETCPVSRSRLTAINLRSGASKQNNFLVHYMHYMQTGHIFFIWLLWLHCRQRA